MEILELDPSQRVVFVDGECAICQRSAHFIIRHDKTASIFIASLQSPLGQATCKKVGQDINDINTVIFFDQGHYYQRSSACLRVGAYFSFPYNFLSRLGLLVPVPLRDGVYRFVAGNRLRFNKKISCPLPSEEIRARFLG